MFETPLIPYVFVGRDEADCNYTCISANSRGEKKENRKLKFQMFTQRYAVRPGLHGRIWTGSVHSKHPPASSDSLRSVETWFISGHIDLLIGYRMTQKGVPDWLYDVYYRGRAIKKL